MTNTDETYHCGTLLDASGDATLISGTWPAAVESADILSCELAPKSVRARNLHDAQCHTEFVDAFYRIGRERANKIVVLTGARGSFIIDVDSGREYWREGESILHSILTWASNEGIIKVLDHYNQGEFILPGDWRNRHIRSLIQIMTRR